VDTPSVVAIVLGISAFMLGAGGVVHAVRDNSKSIQAIQIKLDWIMGKLNGGHLPAEFSGDDD